MKQIIILLFLVLFSCKTETKTEVKAQNTTKKIVSDMWDSHMESNPQFEIFEPKNGQNTIIADFNEDGIPDSAVLLVSVKNDKDNSDAEYIKLAIFEGQKDGSYQLKNQTGDLISFQTEITVVRKNVISLKHQSMRHDYELKFRYESKYKDYMLIGSEYNNYGNGTQIGAGNISTNYLSVKRISTINGKKTTSVATEIQPISAINDDNIYALISG